MERNIAIKLWVISLLLSTLASANAKLIDQTVALVGSRAITLREVEIDAFVHEILDTKSVSKTINLRENDERFLLAREASVRRALIKNYLTSTGVLPEPPEKDVQRIRDKLRSYFGSEEQMHSRLEKLSIDTSEIQSAVTEQAYTDYFVRDYLPSRIKANSKLGRDPDRQAKVERELEQWIETESKRTEVLLLPLKLQKNGTPSTSTP